MRRLKTIIMFVFCVNMCFAHEFVKIDTINANEKLKQLISNPIKRTFKVDFTGDGKDDFICQLESMDTINYKYQEVWIDSDYRKVKVVEKYATNYDYFQFVNIDSDYEPEILLIQGDSDGMDYCLIDQNFKNGQDQIIFYFNPVIIDAEKFYWGYPWNISGIFLKEIDGNIKMKCSLNHEITRDEVHLEPEWQKQLPVIFFKGVSYQFDVGIEKINSVGWLTKSTIIESVDKRK